MYYFDKNNNRRFFSKLFEKKIGSGSQVSVYSCNSKVAKIYPHFLSEYERKRIKYLSSLHTERILMPESFIYQLNCSRGYVCKRVVSLGNIYKVTKEFIVEELKLLEKEINYLSNNYVLLNDFIYDNFMYDGKFRFVDAGSYNIDFDGKKESISKIYKHNMEEFKCFLFDDLLYLKLCEFMDCYLAFQLCSDLRVSCDSLPSTFLECNMRSNESLEEYVFRLKK